MKRIFAVCILLAMSTFLTACGGPAAAEGGDGTYQTIELTMPQSSICWAVHWRAVIM